MKALKWRRTIRPDWQDQSRLRLWPIGWALAACFAAALIGLAVIWWVALALLSFPTLPHSGVISLHDTVGVAQLVFASVAGAGALVALVMAYRRQRVAETAVAHDRTRVFNERFTTTAAQLGDPSAAVRLAGVHAMAGLADDWQENPQTCVDVLCAYLRLPYEPEPSEDAPATERLEFQANREVRHTVIRVITNHLRDGAAPSWQALEFDFSGVLFDGGDFTRTRFSSARADFSGAKFSGGTVDFRDAEFSRGRVAFYRAIFAGGTVDFRGAKFSDCTVSFRDAEFSGGEVTFQDAKFSSGQVNFGGAMFSGGEVSFGGAEFSGGEVSFGGAEFSSGHVFFRDAEFSGGEVSFGGAMFDGSAVDFGGAEFSGSAVDFGGDASSGDTIVPADPPIFLGSRTSRLFPSSTQFFGGTISFTGAKFSGGEVSFGSALFYRGKVSFGGAMFVGGEVSFCGAEFAGGELDFGSVADWSHPPSWDGLPPASVTLPAARTGDPQ